MKLRVLCIGTRMPAWVEAGVAEYGKRLPRGHGIEWVPIDATPRSGRADSDKLRESDSKKILDRLRDGERLIALDEGGRMLSSTQLADISADWELDGRDVALAIGGADGHSRDLLQRAEWSWSLSKLTLPHALVRVLLAEQLYRAWSIRTNHPYHRE